MSAIPMKASEMLLPLPVARATRRSRRRRSNSLRRLAAGYRLMAWRACRRGDMVGSIMHAECARALWRESKRGSGQKAGNVSRRIARRAP